MDNAHENRKEMLLAWKAQKRHRNKSSLSGKENVKVEYNLRRPRQGKAVTEFSKARKLQKVSNVSNDMEVDSNSSGRNPLAQVNKSKHRAHGKSGKNPVLSSQSVQCELDDKDSELRYQRLFLRWRHFVVQHRQEQREVELHRYVQQLEDKIDESQRRSADLEKRIALHIEAESQHERIRRALHEKVQDLKGSIRVFGRMRPIFEGETALDLTRSTCDVGDAIEVRYSSNNRSRKAKFGFDRVFDGECLQEVVFDEVRELVTSAMDGHNVSLFCYGPTGTGKTHTLTGPPGSSMSDECRGIIPRAVEQLFAHSARLLKQNWTFTFAVTYFEIYNETIRDLLDPATKKRVAVKLNSDGRPVVSNIQRVEVQSPEIVYKLLLEASQHRAFGSTNCNERSSRSHCVFQLHIRGSEPVQGEQVNSVLNLVDLAGSERLDRSKASGKLLKETQSINKSLSHLGVCIKELSSGSPHVSYRSSTLTYALQEALASGKALFLVHWSPNSEDAIQSVNTLRFADTLQNCHRAQAIRSQASS